MRVLISFLFVCFAWFSQSQVVFYKMYSGNGHDRGEGIVQLADSSYTITGSSSSWSGNSDAFLLHVDSLGNYLWSKNYGGDESDGGRRVLYSADLGYYIAGFSNSFSGNGNYDGYLIHTDVAGNKLWEKTYGSQNWEKINDAILNPDSTIILVGESQPLNGDGTDIYIIKTNSAGDTLWTKTFGSAGNDRANTIISIEDSMFIVGGELFVPDSNLVKGFILKMDKNGDVLWQDTIGDLIGEYGVNDVFLGINKFYAVGKRKVSDTNFDDYFGSFDFTGGLVFQYTLNTPKNTLIDEVAFLPGMNKTVIGTRSIDTQTYQDDFDNIIAYCDSYFGYFEGSGGNGCTVSNEGLDKCNQILPTNDGGYIAVGFNSNTGDNITTFNGGSNIYLAKIFPGLPHPIPIDAISGVVNFGQLVITPEIASETINVYPNPFSTVLHVEINQQEIKSIQLFNHLGQIMRQEMGIDNFELNTSSLAEGLYLLNVDGVIYKIIKR